VFIKALAIGLHIAYGKDFMKNIWLLLTKYNDFFLFVLFFCFSFYLVVSNNGFQRSSTFNSSNALVGGAYAQVNYWKNYLKLDEANLQLVAENAELRQQLQALTSRDTTTSTEVVDSVYEVRYKYITAQVANNSIHQKNNYLTINKGSLHGIEKGMGVISPTGVVGIVLQVSPHFSTVQSVLHSDTRISASLVESNAFGSLMWGTSLNPKHAVLKDIPNHVLVQPGEAIVTSGYSLFPPGIPLGKVIKTDNEGGESFFNIWVELTTDFHNLQHVYVVQDLYDLELKTLGKELAADG
jgi:rod shape-determining protein MreC